MTCKIPNILFQTTFESSTTPERKYKIEGETIALGQIQYFYFRSNTLPRSVVSDIIFIFSLSYHHSHSSFTPVSYSS